MVRVVCNLVVVVDQFGESRISVVEIVSLLSFAHGTHDEHIGVGCKALDTFQTALRRAEPAKMRTVWPSRPQTRCKVVNITLVSNDFIAAGLQYAHLFARFCLRDVVRDEPLFLRPFNTVASKFWAGCAHRFSAAAFG